MIKAAVNESRREPPPKTAVAKREWLRSGRRQTAARLRRDWQSSPLNNLCLWHGCWLCFLVALQRGTLNNFSRQWSLPSAWKTA
jgi:hypothetical protein